MLRLCPILTPRLPPMSFTFVHSFGIEHQDSPTIYVAEILSPVRELAAFGEGVVVFFVDGFEGREVLVDILWWVGWWVRVGGWCVGWWCVCDFVGVGVESGGGWEGCCACCS